MTDQIPHQRLSEYLDQCQKAIKAALPGSSWVVAELSSIKGSPKGHVYLDVLDSENGQEIAKARALMFAPVARSVFAKWQEATGGQPQAGMKLLMQVKGDFSVQFGFSLQVTGIDPAYTLGDMQMQVQKVIAALQGKGLYDLQRGLRAPSGYWRVAVISPHEAAGLADFRRDADRLDQAGVCSFEYFSAVFQGKDASESIRGALWAAHERHQEQPFDVLCVIRGGGSKADLAWLNDGTLAAWLCRFPIPVFTGIGHEIDECVLDLVAYRRFDTPSKVIGFFKSVFQAEAAAIAMRTERITSGLLKLVAGQRALIEQASPRFSDRSRRLLAQQEKRIAAAGHAFAQGQSRLINQQRSRIQLMAGAFQRLSLRRCMQQGHEVERASTRFAAASQAMLQREQGRLSMVTTLYDKTNPLTLLSKGFALVRDERGQLVTSATQARDTGGLLLTFADGQLAAQVAEGATRSNLAGDVSTSRSDILESEPS